MTRGIPGRLKPKNFGYAMPVSNPPIDPPPYYFRGTEVLTFAYETDSDAAAAIVPEGLMLSDSPTIAQISFVNFHFSTLGAYKEVIFAIQCLWEGQPVLYFDSMLVTGEVGLIAGREPYGCGKLFANIEWTKENNLISAYAERPAGKRVVTGVMRPRDILTPAPVLPFVSLKVIPSPEEGAPPEVCELVMVKRDYSLIVSSDGRSEGFSGPGNVTFDSPSVITPFFRLPVRNMVQASWGRYNSVLPYGKVIKRYAPCPAAVCAVNGVPQPRE